MATHPIHKAARKGDLEVVERLIQEGADIDTLNDDGYTPLHCAAKNGHVAVIEALVRLGSNAIDAPTAWDKTPLFLAAVYDRGPAIEALVRLGSTSLERLDKYGWAPIHVAGISGNPEAVKALHALGAGDPLEDEDEAHEVRWRVYFRESLVEKLLFAASTCENVAPVKR